MKSYIEREATIETIKKERNYTGKFTFEEEHAWAVGFQQGITFALSDIAAIPAADVAPVRRGQWIAADDVGDCCYKCSECGFVRDAYLLDARKYCPNCGAKMDGES